MRELQNCIERAVALARYEQIAVDDLPEKIRDYRAATSSWRRRPDRARADGGGRAALHPARARGGAGNKTAAARVLGFERKTLYRKLDKLGIDGD